MKKTSGNWYVAATHYLTAGFVPGIIVSILASLILGALTTNSLVTQLVSFFLPALAAWLGIMYSARYLARKYAITDSGKVVMFSTIYYAVVNVGIPFVFTFMFFSHSLGSSVSLVSGVPFLSNILGLLVFYFESKKLIHNDQTPMNPVSSTGIPAVPPINYSPSAN